MSETRKRKKHGRLALRGDDAAEADRELRAGRVKSLAYTGVKLEREHPEVVPFLMEKVREIGLNYRRLAREVIEVTGAEDTEQEIERIARLVRGIMIRHMTSEDRRGIALAHSEMAVLEGISATRESIDTAAGNGNLVQGLAIATKSLNEVYSLKAGKATRITGREEGEEKDAAYYRRKAAEAMARKREESIEVEVVSGGA